jgi:HD-like signal output (HDOD) protein
MDIMSTPTEIADVHEDLKSACESIARLCRGSEASLQEIGRRLLQYPTLSELAIHAANATTHGVRKSVTRVDQAVLVLGTQRIDSLVRKIAAQEPAADETHTPAV